jgi:hypothetical protein
MSTHQNVQAEIARKKEVQGAREREREKDRERERERERERKERKKTP